MNTTQTTSEINHLRCRACNTLLPPAATFCGNCGERVAQSTRDNIQIPSLRAHADVAERYRISSLARRSPFVQLFFAQDTQQQRPVVIRAIDVSRLDNTARAQAFSNAQHEYDLLRRLNIPDIMPLIDLRANDSQISTIAAWPFPIQERITTKKSSRQRFLLYTLQDLLQSGIGLPDEQTAISWIYRLCRAVESLHAQDMLIGDLDPAAIIVSGDSYASLPALMVSWLPGEIRNLLPYASRVFTLSRFTAPEIEHGSAEVRSDVYSLGAMLYLLLTGTTPSDTKERARRPLRSPRDLNAALGSAVSAIVTRALSLQPDERFQNAEEMSEALLQLCINTQPARTTKSLAALTPSAALPPTPVRSRKSRQGRKNEATTPASNGQSDTKNMGIKPASNGQSDTKNTVTPISPTKDEVTKVPAQMDDSNSEGSSQTHPGAALDEDTLTVTPTQAALARIHLSYTQGTSETHNGGISVEIQLPQETPTNQTLLEGEHSQEAATNQTLIQPEQSQETVIDQTLLEDESLEAEQQQETFIGSAASASEQSAAQPAPEPLQNSALAELETAPLPLSAFKEAKPVAERLQPSFDIYREYQPKPQQEATAPVAEAPEDEDNQPYQEALEYQPYQEVPKSSEAEEDGDTLSAEDDAYRREIAQQDTVAFAGLVFSQEPATEEETQEADGQVPATEEETQEADGQVPAQVSEYTLEEAAEEVYEGKIAKRSGDGVIANFKQFFSGPLPALPRLAPGRPTSDQSESEKEVFLKRLKRFFLGEQQRMTSAAAIVETPLRVQPDQHYLLRIHIMGRDEATKSETGLSSLAQGDTVHIEIRSALYKNYAYIVQQADVDIPARGFAAEVTMPMHALTHGPNGRRERLHIFIMDAQHKPLYEKPFAVELFISHLVHSGQEGHNVLTIPR